MRDYAMLILLPPSTVIDLASVDAWGVLSPPLGAGSTTTGNNTGSSTNGTGGTLHPAPFGCIPIPVAVDVSGTPWAPAELRLGSMLRGLEDQEPLLSLMRVTAAQEPAATAAQGSAATAAGVLASAVAAASGRGCLVRLVGPSGYVRLHHVTIDLSGSEIPRAVGASMIWRLSLMGSMLIADGRQV
jgi:hypothetical protein